ncbi:MAG TPA: hypothetical protein DG942_01935 [Ruminococcaceae bacterium]|mgnify:CR=1 FL=1|nr:hypothetical protein [Oscillospiraceae bacterium]
MLNSIWIELHQEMPRHPKTLALAQALKVSRREAVGILVDLWTWGLSCADEDGRLKSIGDEGIALALDWPSKKAGDLAQAFVQCGWLDRLDDGTYRLHDWPDYTSKLSEKRKDAERKRQARKHGQSKEKQTKTPDVSERCPPNVRGQSADNPRNVRTMSRAESRNPRAGITSTSTKPNQDKLSDNNTPSSPTVEDTGHDAGAGTDFGCICQAFEAKINPMPSAKDGSVLSELYRDYPVQRILDAIDEAARCQGRSAPYVRSVLQNEDRKAKAPPNTGPDLTDPNRYKNFGK